MKANEKHSEDLRPQTAAAAGAGEKVPAFEQGEDRLTPVAEKPERKDDGKAENGNYGNNGSYGSDGMASVNPAAPMASKSPEGFGEAGADGQEAGAADAAGRSAIGAIAAAMAIDTRLAHALVDIHAGMDGAEAIARAYGVPLPGRGAKADNGSDVNHGSNGDEERGGGGCGGGQGGGQGGGVPPVSRLPEGVVSVPSFLNTQRRSFWE